MAPLAARALPADRQVAAVPAAPVLLRLCGGDSFGYHHRPRPSPTPRQLLDGVTYIREVLDEPLPMIVHVVVIDLDAPGSLARHVAASPGPSNCTARTALETRSQAYRWRSTPLSATPSTRRAPLALPLRWRPVRLHGFAAAGGRQYSEHEGQVLLAVLHARRQRDHHGRDARLYAAPCGLRQADSASRMAWSPGPSPGGTETSWTFECGSIDRTGQADHAVCRRRSPAEPQRGGHLCRTGRYHPKAWRTRRPQPLWPRFDTL